MVYNKSAGMPSLILLIIIVLINSNEAASILAIFPTPSISHQIVFRSLTQALAARGHNILVITPDPAFTKETAPDNIKEIDVHNMSYSLWVDRRKELCEGNQSLLDQMSQFLQLVTNIQEKYFENEEILNLINNSNKTFDLLLIEAMAKPTLIFSHFYEVPVIQVSSFGAIFDNYESMGAPNHPILYPAVTRRKINNLSIKDKIFEIYEQFLLDMMVSNHERIDDAMLQKYLGHDIPTVRELKNNVDMLFLNIHPVFDGIHPVPQSVIHIGEILQNPRKELQQDLKSYLDASTNGVIYFSMGTNVVPSLLLPEKIEAFLKVFSELPYNILWKYDKDELPGKTDNIRIAKWFPQADLLRHPNIKLYIMQGGLQSTFEAIQAGVPLIGIPLLGDQWFNTAKFEHHKIGIKLDIKTLNYDVLKKVINTVLGDDSFRRNIVHLRELMEDEPMKPLERAVWWTEYVLRHRGAKHLRSPAANITWAEYLEIKLVLLLLSGWLISLTILVKFFFYVCKTVLRLFQICDNNAKKKAD